MKLRKAVPVILILCHMAGAAIVFAYISPDISIQDPEAVRHRRIYQLRNRISSYIDSLHADGADSWSYGRLREACQTEVDGTSIDTIEEVAVQLGLEAEQIMIVIDGYMDEIIEGKLYSVKKGDVLTLPSNMEHGGRIGEVDCSVIDIFSPPREDFVEKLKKTLEKIHPPR